MSNQELKMRCQRCGSQMEMRDPAPGGPWKPDQFWVCSKCGRHFWTTHPAAPKPAVPNDASAPAVPAGGGVGPPSP